MTCAFLEGKKPGKHKGFEGRERRADERTRLRGRDGAQRKDSSEAVLGRGGIDERVSEVKSEGCE